MLVLQADNAGIIHRNRLHIFSALQQTFWLELLAAQTNHHHFAAKIRVKRNVVNGANRHHGSRSVDRHAAAVQVVQAHHTVDVRVFWQQIALDDFHHVIHHARHTMHAGGNAEQVFGADTAIFVAIAFEGVAFQRR
ncbi:hypothetical protein D3C72_1142240 [compost metagenome]